MGRHRNGRIDNSDRLCGYPPPYRWVLGSTPSDRFGLFPMCHKGRVPAIRDGIYMYVEENGHLTVRDQVGNRIADFETQGFYPYRKARLEGGSLALLRGVRFSYKGESGGDNHRVYKTRNGFISCSDHSVAIGVSACLF